VRNNVTGAATQLSCASVFVFIGAEPAADWLPAEIARDAKGFLLAGADVVASGQWPRRNREPCTPSRVIRRASSPKNTSANCVGV
jgi:thioredoxin reductase (NADPH)